MAAIASTSARVSSSSFSSPIGSRSRESASSIRCRSREIGARSSWAALEPKRRIWPTPACSRSIMSFSVPASRSSSSPLPVWAMRSSRRDALMRRAASSIRAIGRSVPRTSHQPNSEVARIIGGSAYRNRSRMSRELRSKARLYMISWMKSEPAGNTVV